MTRRSDVPVWTPQQQTAIDHRGKDVYVAASAGTGQRRSPDRTLCPYPL